MGNKIDPANCIADQQAKALATQYQLKMYDACGTDRACLARYVDSVPAAHDQFIEERAGVTKAQFDELVSKCSGAVQVPSTRGDGPPALKNGREIIDVDKGGVRRFGTIIDDANDTPTLVFGVSYSRSVSGKIKTTEMLPGQTAQEINHGIGAFVEWMPISIGEGRSKFNLGVFGAWDLLDLEGVTHDNGIHEEIGNAHVVRAGLVVAKSIYGDVVALSANFGWACVAETDALAAGIEGIVRDADPMCKGLAGGAKVYVRWPTPNIGLFAGWNAMWFSEGRDVDGMTNNIDGGPIHRFELGIAVFF